MLSPRACDQVPPTKPGARLKLTWLFLSEYIWQEGDGGLKNSLIEGLYAQFNVIRCFCLIFCHIFFSWDHCCSRAVFYYLLIGKQKVNMYPWNSPLQSSRGTLQCICVAPVYVLPVPSLETSNGTLFPVRLNNDSSTCPQCPCNSLTLSLHLHFPFEVCQVFLCPLRFLFYFPGLQ